MNVWIKYNKDEGTIVIANSEPQQDKPQPVIIMPIREEWIKVSVPIDCSTCEEISR